MRKREKCVHLWGDGEGKDGGEGELDDGVVRADITAKAGEEEM